MSYPLTLNQLPVPKINRQDERIKREIKGEERNCWGYVFRLQKQSGENFLAFAPNGGPVCREDRTQRRGLLLEEARREAPATA